MGPPKVHLLAHRSVSLRGGDDNARAAGSIGSEVQPTTFFLRGGMPATPGLPREASAWSCGSGTGGACKSQRTHPPGAGLAQGLRSRFQRGPRGGDVVDQQHMAPT